MENQMALSEPGREAAKPGLHHWASLLVFVTAALSLLVAIRPAGVPGGKLPGWLDPGAATILAQIGLILVPALLFVWLTRQPARAALKLHPVGIGSGAKSLLIGLLCWPIFSTLTSLSQFALALLAPTSAGGPEVPVTNIASPWLLLIATALAAPVCEEILFRGVILGAYERRFGRHAIWLVGILFAFFHFDLGRIAGALLVGLVAGWLAYRTRSIWPGMLVHFGANLPSALLILVTSFAVPAGAEGAVQEAAAQAGDPMALFWLGTLVWGGIGLVLLIPMYVLLKNIAKQKPALQWAESQMNPGSLWSAAGLIIAGCAYFATQLIALIGQ